MVKDNGVLGLSSKVSNGRIFRVVIGPIIVAAIIATAVCLYGMSAAVAVNSKGVTTNEANIEKIGLKLQEIGEDTAFIRGRLEERAEGREL